MKSRNTAKFRVAIGQVGLLMSLLLFALLLGLIPDRQGAIRQSRAALAESVAINVSGHVMRADLGQMKQDLNIVVERNSDLESAAIIQGTMTRVEIGDHSVWQKMGGEYSTDSQVLVPIFSGNDKWGQLELRFKKTAGTFGWDVTQAQVLPLLGFLAVTSFIVFYLYLGKMLKHLDPSRAIPQRVQSALDTMAEGLLVIDIKGQIVLANGSIAKTLQIEVDDLLGRQTSDFGWQIGGDRVAGELPPWSTCLKTGMPQRNSVVNLNSPDGVPRTFIVNCSPVMAGDRQGGALISFDDVTQLEEKKMELQIAMEAAEAANLSKSEFLANMSHEIRTPMNAILGFTDILRRGYGKSDQDPREYLNTIHSSGQHLLELINDILDLSKVESGRLEVERISCNPCIIAQEVIQVLMAKATEKGLDLDLNIEGKIPESITSDPARIRQIITNLVGNAIKFTSQGQVTVQLQMSETNVEQLLIKIRDTGIGMSHEQLDKIFDPFSQADTSVTRKFGGTGLGLAISKRFANALGGGIVVDSLPGVGSTFTLTLATGSLQNANFIDAESVGQLHEASIQSVTNWTFEKQRVLVVDDGKENRELVTLVLEEANLHVTAAEDGQEACELVTSQPFDLILMDMQMPVMDGYTATRWLRDQGIETPIYALTAHAMAGFEQGCLDAGCTGFLTKPIDIDELLNTIGSVLQGTCSQFELPNHSLARVEIPSDVEATSPLFSQLPMDKPSFRQIVVEFVPRLHQKLDELQVAFENENDKTMYELAHWLKGAGGTVGFPQFTEPAATLEKLVKAKQSPKLIQATIDQLRTLASRIEIPTLQQINKPAAAQPEPAITIQETNY